MCTTYCGYVKFLIVVIFITRIFLIIILLFLLFFFVLNGSIIILNIKLFNTRFLADLEILFNVWRVFFLIIVLIIRTTVLLFSFSYIRGVRVVNFIMLYLSFIVRILWLILNNRFYWIIFGWDGLGVVSFLLIVFYINYERVNNGLFTVFQNRIGDLFFVIFILGRFSIVLWRALVLKWGLLFLVFGACVKRAQFPFNSWLLAAIRAPTPISSLVHSSTLVVAGVFILLQFSYCLLDILIYLKYIRIFSLFLRRFGLMNESDIKKLIAYSTINHVSLIIYLISFKLFKVAYFHLNIHAIFKSLIFMCFGFVILSSFHGQDKRLISLRRLNPVIKIIYYFSCLCLAGLPFLSGFFSKDLIIEKVIIASFELIFVIRLFLFLGIRIYYRVKLMKLWNIVFSYRMVEKRVIGMWSILFITVVIILTINIYLRLVFRLTLEFVSFKMFIYIIIVIFLFVSLITNLNYKIKMYEKVQNFKEVWGLDIYSLEKFIYWNRGILMELIIYLGYIKLFLIINWWVIVVFIVIF